MQALKHALQDEEIMAFNQKQSEKIIAIRKKQLARENQKRNAREKMKSMIVAMLLLALFSSMFAVIIYRNSLVNEKKYEIFSLKSEIKSLNTQIEELQTEVEHSTDIKTVETIAKETLNMQYPTTDQYVYIDATQKFAVSGAIISAQAEADQPKEVAEQSKENVMNDMISAIFKTN